MLSWLCDVCGYENEFNDASQPTACRCCSEPAPESKIIKAKRELEAYHREEERQARLEALRREQELRQQKIDRIVVGITRAVKAVSAVTAATVIIAFAWVGASFHSEGTTMSAWNTQMHTNIGTLSLTGYPDKLKNNLADIGLSEKLFIPIEETERILSSQTSEHFSAISANIKMKSEISASGYSANIEELNKFVTALNNDQSDNALIVLESVGSNLKQIGENVQELINAREGGADD